jgi:hypothetical protein
MRKLERRLRLHLRRGDRVLVLGTPRQRVAGIVETCGGRLFACDPSSDADLAWARSQKEFDCILALDLRRWCEDGLADQFRSLGKPRASLFVWFQDRCALAPRTGIASSAGLMAVKRKKLVGLLGREYRVLKCTALGTVHTDSSRVVGLARALFPAAVIVMELTGRG